MEKLTEAGQNVVGILKRIHRLLVDTDDPRLAPKAAIVGRDEFDALIADSVTKNREIGAPLPVDMELFFRGLPVIVADCETAIGFSFTEPEL